MIDVSQMHERDTRNKITAQHIGVPKMPATSTTTVRFDHSNCKHARTGAEGKKARAACRKAHAAEAKAGTTGKKATTTRSTAAPRKRAVKKSTVPAVPTSTDDIDEMVDNDI